MNTKKIRLCCMECGSKKWLKNSDEADNNFCGCCGQPIGVNITRNAEISEKLPVIISQSTSPRCPRCNSCEWLTNPDEENNNYCGQCGQPIDWENAYDEDAEMIVAIEKEPRESNAEFHDNDNSSQIIEDIKWTLFDDRSFELLQVFATWSGDGHSFVLTDKDGMSYKLTVEKLD